MTVRGEPDEYGMVMNLTDLKSIMEVLTLEVALFLNNESDNSFRR